MLPAFVSGQNLDFDPEKVDGQFEIGHGAWEPDTVFFGGDDEIEIAPDTALDELAEFAVGEPVMVGEAFGDFEGGTEVAQFVFEAGGLGDARDGTDVFALEEVEGFAFVRVKVLQVERLVGALDDFRGAVQGADPSDELGVAAGRGFGDEDVVGAAEVGRGFAQGATRKKELVAEGGLAVDEADFEPVPKAEVLHAVIEDEGIDAHVADGVHGAFDAVFVDEDHHVAEAACEHEGFVTSKAGIEEQLFAVMNDAGFFAFEPEPFPLEPAEEWGLAAFVTAAEDGDGTAVVLERAREFFDHGRFSGAADGEVADGDDQAARGMFAEHAFAVEPDPALDNSAEQPGKREKESAEEGSAFAVPAFEDDGDGELLEIFKPAAEHGLVGVKAEGAGVVGVGDDGPCGSGAGGAHGVCNGLCVVEGDAADSGA